MSAFTVMAALAHDWARRCFGDQVSNIPVRTLRLAEEAIELAQAAGVPKEKLQDMIDIIYQRPKGRVHNEIGGVLLTTAVLCEQLRVPMETYLREELRRVLDKPTAHFAARNEEKIGLGLNV